MIESYDTLFIVMVCKYRTEGTKPSDNTIGHYIRWSDINMTSPTLAYTPFLSNSWEVVAAESNYYVLLIK